MSVFELAGIPDIGQTGALWKSGRPLPPVFDGRRVSADAGNGTAEKNTNDPLRKGQGKEPCLWAGRRTAGFQGGVTPSGWKENVFRPAHYGHPAIHSKDIPTDTG